MISVRIFSIISESVYLWGQKMEWIGRIVFAAAGVILIVVSASQHGPKEAAGIITGVACVLFAIYATIRGLAGGVQAEDQQVIGLINLSKWYDIVVFLVLLVVSIIAWVV